MFIIIFLLKLYKFLNILIYFLIINFRQSCDDPWKNSFQTEPSLT